MANPHFERRQLVFPMDTTAPDYSEAVMLVVGKLAAMEGRSVEAVIKNLLEVGDDAIAFRVTTPRQDERSLPLAFAGSMVAGVQQLLLASACTVLKPAGASSETKQDRSAAVSRDRQVSAHAAGEFRAECVMPGAGLGMCKRRCCQKKADAPFVRRTTATLRESIGRTGHGDRNRFVGRIRRRHQEEDVNPIVSSNLCEALTRFEDASLKNSVENRHHLGGGDPQNQRTRDVYQFIRIQPMIIFSRIEGKCAASLRSKEQHFEDVFPATVVTAGWRNGPDGKRAGEVNTPLAHRGR